MKIEVWTDGSCSTNTGKGGWAYFIQKDGAPYRIASGAAIDTTNNRMELQAIIESILFLEAHFPNSACNIYTDSAYVCNCFRDKWYVRWEQNGWRSANRMPVKNRDLWELLLDKYRNSNLTFFILKVAGHADNENNNMVDEFARRHEEYEKTFVNNR